MPPDVQARLAAEFNAPHPGDRDLDTEATLAALVATGAEALLFSSHLKLDAGFIGRLPAGVRIAATSSAGYDHVDVDAARARGLIVTNTPDVLTDCTADLTMLLILAACRRAQEYGAIMHAGWRKGFGLGDMLGVRVSGRTLGIIGMGRIGRAVAQRARGFGMTILYSGPRRLPPDLEQGATYYAEFREMLPHCQVLSLNAPGGPATAGLMDAAAFAALPQGAVFVNASRGSLVDEAALLAALDSGHLFAAGLDVFHNEPAFDTRFAERSNVFLTPHMGSATVETRNAMGFRALDNIAAVLSGREPMDPLWR
jgi:lactate dehydrogenase-like 2-hydroxyacid dehydrogenase